MALPAQEELAAAREPALWSRWRADGDADARQALLAGYAAWARKVARGVFMRVRGRSDDWPDYVQNASIGLIEARESFDPARGVPFEAYARQRVRGAVFNGLRSLAAAHVAHEHGIVADRRESLLEDDSADPVERLIRLVSSLGLGYALGTAMEAEHVAVPTPYDVAVEQQLRERVHGHLARIPERERLVLELHYLQHLAFVDIAQVLDVTKGRISQIHRQALERLRSRMQADAWQLAL